ncbi:MAG: 16S rRNA processing protein RimM [Clostridia bacterium]|jgi:16S rRNA processing protein RimM|nr:16S rRNA processing protein RimM [Clostridia bacterium]
MRRDYLEVGKIVSTHGIKGEVRVDPWCDGPAFLKQFKTLYYDKNGARPVAVKACRPHSNIAILKLEGVDTVEAAAALRNKVLFMARADASLPDNHFFIQDLIGCRVCDADAPEKQYGVLTDVSTTGANDVWHVTDDSGKEYLLPAIPPVVIDTDIDNERILIRPLKGIFDDAD